MKRKNGFTLIELLAVIVILAIIALIATPIILGIVEDAKRDAFLRSVELVVSTTDMDIATKTFEEEYTYTITDGVVSNLEIGVKNTEGMNGSIRYDKEGNEIYAIHNGKYCVKKTDEMEKAEISEYVEGKCTTRKYLLQEITKLVPNEKDVVTSGTGILSNFGTYGIRYQGANPNNYVYFNCSDYSNQTLETCELWRIIGVVDGNVKIIRNESIGNMKWDDNTDGSRSNNWASASLQIYLNGEYYAGLTEDSKSMIKASTWYLRGHDDSYVTRDALYHIERATGTIYGTNQEKLENINIGLMYISDFFYAAIENEDCVASGIALACKNTNWLVSSSSYYEWLITHHFGYSASAFAVGWTAGDVYGNGRYDAYNIGNAYVVRPTLYLTSNTAILDGDGTQEKPYTLSVE